MCPTPAEIGTYWTDELICISLDGERRGYPLPRDVISNINPYCMPENLSDDSWYFIRKGTKKDAETGFWKARGAPLRVFSNTSIDGWRSTLEFHRGRDPNACKTDWVMQEFAIIQKGPFGNRKLEESNSLCRVFLSGGQSSSHGNQNLTAAGGAGGSQIDEAKCEGGQIVDSKSRSQPQVKVNDGATLVAGSERPTHRPAGKNNDPYGDCMTLDDFASPSLVAESERPTRSAENMVENNDPSAVDYMILDDLVSPSFSSENSSGVTVPSDEYSESSGFLQELDPQQMDADCKLIVFASSHPNKVVLCPAKSESLHGSGDRSKLAANEITKADHSPSGSAATKDNSLNEKASARVAKTEDPRNKLVASEITKTDHSPSGSATKDNFPMVKVPAHAAKTKEPDLRKEGASSISCSAASSSGSVSLPKAKAKTKTKTKANTGQKKCWMCFLPF